MESTKRQDFLLSRARQPAGEAVVFMENRVSVPGQDAPVYVDSLDRFATVEEAKRQEQISAELWRQANDEKDKLFALMEQVRAKLDKKSTSNSQPAELDLRHCTWDQVMQEVQSTAIRWSTTPKRTSRMMLCLDKLGRNSDAFQSWLQVLPGGDYGSSICGVFALAIGAVGQYTKVEDAVLEALVEIPEAIQGARRYIQIYSDMRDHLLERKTFDLYLSILKALTHIMRFFADSSLRKVYQPLLKQSSYQNELLAGIEDVKNQVSRIKEEANQCSHRRQMDMNRTVLTQGSMLESIYMLLLNNPRLRVSSQDLDAEESISRELEPVAASRKAIEHLATNTMNQRIERAKELLNLLQFNPKTVPKDIETCLRIGDAMDENSISRAAAMIQNRMFKAFMTEASSAPLLVNGNEDLSCAEGLSPLSVVAARLARISLQTESSFVLSYFCGEHRPYIDRSLASSPVGMMASLVGQLISQMLDKSANVDVSFLSKVQRANLMKLKLSTLYNTFQELTHQLPLQSVLICVLDEVSLYETGIRRSDTDTVFRRLTRLVKRHDKIVFKLLVTCRGRAIEISQYFTGHILDLDEAVEAEDSSAWQIANMSF